MEPSEYNEFFKATFREFVDPLATSHFSVEGTIEFSAILFVPGMAPFEQQARMLRQRAFRLTGAAGARAQQRKLPSGVAQCASCGGG